MSTAPIGLLVYPTLLPILILYLILFVRILEGRKDRADGIFESIFTWSFLRDVAFAATLLDTAEVFTLVTPVFYHEQVFLRSDLVLSFLVLLIHFTVLTLAVARPHPSNDYLRTAFPSVLRLYLGVLIIITNATTLRAIVGLVQ